MRRRTLKLLLLALVVVMFLGVAYYFSEQNKDIPVDGECNFGAAYCESFTGTNENVFDAGDGFKYAVFSITAKSITGTSDFSTNQLKWIAYADGTEYESDWSATYNCYGYKGTESIEKDETVQFSVIFKVPVDTDEINLIYDSGSKVVRNTALDVDMDLTDPNAR